MLSTRKAFGFGLALLFLLGSAAEAQLQFSMSGKYGRRIGPLVNVPQRGANNFTCNNHIVGLAAGPAAITNATPLPLQIPSNIRGCINAASQTVTVNGFGPAGFTVPTNAFALPAPAVPNVIPVTPAPQVIQFGSGGSVNGPPAAPVAAINSTAGAPAAAWRAFKEDAWMTQTGRPGVSFTACWGAPPGGGAPAGAIGPCTNINQGTRGILARYKNANPNAFGGTMGLLLNSAPPNVGITVAFNSILPSVGPGQIKIQNLTGMGTGLPGGRGYRATQTVMSATQMLHSPNVLTTITTTPLFMAVGQIILTLGPAVGTLPPVPAAINNGFPFTTGTVLARNTGTQGGNPTTATLTARGYDSRTTYGMGNIQVVASGVQAATAQSATIDIMTLSFVPEPGSAMLAAAGGLGLIGLARIRTRKV